MNYIIRITHERKNVMKIKMHTYKIEIALEKWSNKIMIPKHRDVSLKQIDNANLYSKILNPIYYMKQHNFIFTQAIKISWNAYYPIFFLIKI